MQSAGVEGSVKIGTFGETDSCGTYYGANEVDYGFTVQVGEFDTRGDIARKLAILQEIARRFVGKSGASQLGRVGVTFERGESQCTLRLEDGKWDLVPIPGTNGAGCQLPTQDQTGPLR